MLFYFVLLFFVEGVVFVHFVLVDFWLVGFFQCFLVVVVVFLKE